MPTDPVCGMTVAPGPGALQLTRGPRTYYFCSTACLHAFADPAAERHRLGGALAVAWPLASAVAALTYLWPTRVGVGLAALLGGIVQFYAGRQFYVGARDAIRQGAGNMDLLIAVGTTAAYGYSLAAYLAPGALPHAYYFDAAALVVTLLLTGAYLESWTRARAGSSLERLARLLPSEAIVIGPRGERRVPVVQVGPGDTVRVAPGSRLPVDGVVRAGRSTVDESILTGESLPVVRGPGDRVLAGSWNREGRLDIQATSASDGTFVRRVADLVSDAEMARVPLRRLADRLASAFVPVVLVLATGAGVFWATIGGGGLTIGVLAFVTVSISACPCAFGIATPAAILAGTGLAADEGILFRGEDALERAARVAVVLTDKTGTLTASEASVTSVLALPPGSERDLLAAVAGAESGIDHPLARAVVAAARLRGVPPTPWPQVTVEPGVGVTARSDQRVVRVVDATALGTSGAEPIAEWVAATVRRGDGWSAVLDGDRLVGALSFSSPLAPGAREGVDALRAEGLRVALVTGDREAPSRGVAAALGIPDVYAGVDPAGKVALVERFRSEGTAVAFVGDGVNDAPALAAADAGFAIGTGTDIARETGQVLLVGGSFAGVATAIRIARATVGRVRANLVWALGYNAVLLPIAAGVLVPLLGFSEYEYLPILGAAAMAVSSTTVVLNSLRLRRMGGRRAGAPAAPPSPLPGPTAA